MPARDRLPSKKKLHENFTYKDGELFWKVPCHGRSKTKPAGNTSIYGYRRVMLEGQSIFLHRAIWKMHHGTEPVYVDHIDRNTLNNRIENLREATAHENIINSDIRKNNTTGYRGVRTANGKWFANARIPGMRIGTCYVSGKKHAARLYDVLSVMLGRGRGVLNFPGRTFKCKDIESVYSKLSVKRKEIKQACGTDVDLTYKEMLAAAKKSKKVKNPT